jgi:hypothetical protein
VANYPVSLDSLTNPVPTDPTTSVSVPHASQHTTANDILEALEAKLGIGASTPSVANRLLGVDSPGVTSWRQLASADVGPAAFDASLTDNVVMNGDFSIWQRNTSFAAANGYTADRWQVQNTTAGAVTVARNDYTTGPTPAIGTPLSPYYLRVQVTTADAAIAAGDIVMLYQAIEGYLWARLAQRQFTLSFWVRATKTGKHCVSFVRGDAGLSYVAEYTVNATNTWEYKTVTISASPSSGTWNYTNGLGMYIVFTLMAGTTYQTTANAWNAGNLRITSGTVNDMDAINNVFDITQIKITPGPYAAPFIARPFQQELALCQRYFQKTHPYGTAAVTIAGVTGALVYYIVVGGAGAVAQINWDFVVPMRTTPTMTYMNTHVNNANAKNLSTGVDSSAAGAGYLGDRQVLVAISQLAGDAVSQQLAVHATASADF